MQEKWTFGVFLSSKIFKSCVRSFSNDAACNSNSETLKSAQDFVRCMRKHAPVFVADSNNITVLYNPKQFYEVLKENIRCATRRVVLASLYIGIGPLEKDLVRCIHEALRRSCNVDQNLNVEILLEYTRGSRGKINSRTLLLPLIKEFASSVKVALYHTPDLRGLQKVLLPERFNETVALTHLKVYLTDDTIIMSGANLSHDYFTNRQDRYIQIANTPEIADYFHGLVSTVSEFSQQLQTDDSTVKHENFPFHPTDTRYTKKQFKAAARKKVVKFQSKWKDTFRHSPSKQNTDTWIVPLIQMYPFKIRQDEFVTSELVRSAHIDCRWKLASGYFNLTEGFMDTILQSRNKFDILMAHPKVNGFYSAKGVAGGIPHAYTLIAKKFYHRVSQQGQTNRITLFEYIQPGWTFHAKGLWCYLPSHRTPSLTLIGSPNFGHRSVYRDLEAQVAIVTDNERLSQELHSEQERLYGYSVRVTEDTFLLSERKTPIWVRLVTKFIKKFL